MRNNEVVRFPHCSADLLWTRVLGVRRMFERSKQADVEVKRHRVGERNPREVRMCWVQNVVPFAGDDRRDRQACGTSVPDPSVTEPSCLSLFTGIQRGPILRQGLGTDELDRDIVWDVRDAENTTIRNRRGKVDQDFQNRVRAVFAHVHDPGSLRIPASARKKRTFSVVGGESGSAEAESPHYPRTPCSIRIRISSASA